MPLVLGSFKIDKRLDDDTHYELPPETKVIVNGQVVPVGQMVAQAVPPEDGISAGDEGGPVVPEEDTSTTPPPSSSTPGTDTDPAITPPGEGSGFTADGDTERIESYQWWTTAELMSYNLEFALESRWQSIGSRAIMDGLSIVNSVGDLFSAIKSLFTGDAYANPAPATEGGNGTLPELNPPASLPANANHDQMEQAIVDYALQFQGLPYIYGSTGPNGYDCSGFVQTVFKNVLGINLPRQADGQALTGIKVDRAELQPGDIVCYYGNPDRMNNIGHVMIYIGNGQVMGFGKPGGVYDIDYRTGDRGYAWAVRVF